MDIIVARWTPWPSPDAVFIVHIWNWLYVFGPVVVVLLLMWATYRAGMAYGERQTYNKMLDSGAWKPSASRHREDTEYWPRPSL